MFAKALVCFVLAVEIVVMVSGAGEVITGATAGTSATVCPATAAQFCQGTLTLCANTVAPATSGTCATFSANENIVGQTAMAFTYTNANLAALGLDLPGTYVVSARQDVVSNGVLTPGTAAEQTITIPSTGTVNTSFTANNGAAAFTVPVTSTTTCSCGTSGTTCTGTDTTDTDVSTTSDANSS